MENDLQESKEESLESLARSVLSKLDDDELNSFMLDNTFNILSEISGSSDEVIAEFVDESTDELV